MLKCTRCDSDVKRPLLAHEHSRLDQAKHVSSLSASSSDGFALIHLASSALGNGSARGSDSLLELGLHDEGLVDVWDDTTTSDSGLDESVELLVTSDSQEQVSGSDSLHLEILRGVSCQLKDFGGEVLKDSSGVDG